MACGSDSEFQNVLMSDDVFDLLDGIGYSGNPLKEKIENRKNLVQ
jgi:hypothetical protein